MDDFQDVDNSRQDEASRDIHSEANPWCRGVWSGVAGAEGVRGSSLERKKNKSIRSF
jgi:hypothetical protein